MTTSAIIWTKTNRGFTLAEFEDAYNQTCSIQDSSSDAPHIWFGVDDMLESRGMPAQQPYSKYGSTYVHVNARMHLSPEQVGELLPVLAFFAEYGRLPGENEAPR